MAKASEFGVKIPDYADIVKIDGDYLIDADGDEFSRNLVELNKIMGGELELAIIDDG